MALEQRQVWWNSIIENHHQRSGRRPQLTRRAFVTGLAGVRFLPAQDRSPSGSNRPADFTLSIELAQIDVAPGHTITTATYNGTAPGPLIRMREGMPATVDIINRTGVPEYVHWHGFEIPPELDGTEEEGSLAVPAGGRIQYEITPLQPGSRYVHSHAMTMNDLSRGVYSGQFVFVYVEPKRNPGRYDQEIFLATHEWEARLTMESEDDSAEEDGDEMEQRSMEIGYAVRSIIGKALGHGRPLQVKQGQRVLFHVLNASATENVQLHLPGHTFHVVALDGNAVPRPGPVSVLELGVGERVDALVEMNNPGVWILGSVDDNVRRNGMGIRLEYAYRQGEPRYAPPGDEPWGYLRFGRSPQESPKPDEV